MKYSANGVTALLADAVFSAAGRLIAQILARFGYTMG